MSVTIYSDYYGINNIANLSVSNANMEFLPYFFFRNLNTSQKHASSYANFMAFFDINTPDSNERYYQHCR